jgi:hypothetical protein
MTRVSLPSSSHALKKVVTGCKQATANGTAGLSYNYGLGLSTLTGCCSSRNSIPPLATNQEAIGHETESQPLPASPPPPEYETLASHHDARRPMAIQIDPPIHGADSLQRFATQLKDTTISSRIRWIWVYFHYCACKLIVVFMAIFLLCVFYLVVQNSSKNTQGKSKPDATTEMLIGMRATCLSGQDLALTLSLS